MSPPTAETRLDLSGRWLQVPPVPHWMPTRTIEFRCWLCIAPWLAQGVWGRQSRLARAGHGTKEQEETGIASVRGP